MSGPGLYAYAITRALDADLSARQGIEDAPLRLVEVDGLGVVVSEVDLEEFGEEGLRRNLEDLRWRDDAAVTVVVAAENYPGNPVTGRVIEGLDEADAVDDAYVLHAGTWLDPDGAVVSTGGRVLSVVGLGLTLAEAREQAYEAVDRIRLEGGHHRSDIALAAELGEVRVP